MGEGRMKQEREGRLKAAILLEMAILFAVLVIIAGDEELLRRQAVVATFGENIKWVDFNVSYEALCKAYTYDVESYGTEHHLDWIELLAYAAAKGGGDFGVGAVEEIHKITEQIQSGEVTMESATKDMKYFSYYKESVYCCARRACRGVVDTGKRGWRLYKKVWS